MCDHDDFDNMQKQQELSRRQFGALGFGAGVIAMLPAVANAADVKESEVSIKTPDGNCDAHFVHPVSGATAAVFTSISSMSLLASGTLIRRPVALMGPPPEETSNRCRR